MRIGLQGKPAPVRMGDVMTLEVGSFAVFRPNKEWGVDQLENDPAMDLSTVPWVGKIVKKPNFDTGHVSVHWFQAATEGKLDGVWNGMLVREKKKKIPFTSVSRKQKSGL